MRSQTFSQELLHLCFAAAPFCFFFLSHPFLLCLFYFYAFFFFSPCFPPVSFFFQPSSNVFFTSSKDLRIFIACLSITGLSYESCFIVSLKLRRVLDIISLPQILHPYYRIMSFFTKCSFPELPRQRFSLLMIILQMGFPWDEKRSSYSVMIFPCIISSL